MVALAARLDICGFIEESGRLFWAGDLNVPTNLSKLSLRSQTGREGGRRNVDCTLINRKKDFILENITGSIAAHKLHGGSSLLEFVLTRLFRDISPVSLSICNLL